jgi:hypothetical protein
VRTLQAEGKLVLGEVKIPWSMPKLKAGRFWAEIPEHFNLGGMVATADPTVRLSQSSGPHYYPPPVWSIFLLLGIPAAVAIVIGLPLGSAYWFPLLGRQRRD